MSDTTKPNETTAVLAPQQGHRRTEVVGASVNTPEKAEIIRALKQGFGFLRPSTAARQVLLAYSRSAAVRDAVAAFLEQAGPQ